MTEDTINMIWLFYASIFAVTKIEYCETSCSIESVQSDQEEYGNYYDDYGDLDYPILYSYVECEYVTIKTDQDLKAILGLLKAPGSRNKKMTNIKYIKFSYSYVPIIYAALLNDFSTTTELYINASSVEEIQPKAFNNLTNLQKIQLDHNNITEISRGVFNHLTNLKTLDVSYNFIKTIERNSFLGLYYLPILLLNNNNLKFLSSDDFPGLKSLTFINLSHNEISNITQILHDNKSFGENINLRIDVSVNFLKTVNFSDLPLRTSELNLNNNQIEKTDGSMMPVVIEISLSCNHILHPPLISDSVIYLNLSSNVIEELILGLFHSNNLTRLDLSNNLIKNLHRDIFDNLTNLELLNLQNNNIDYIPIGLFQALSSLQYLNVSGNKLSKFEYGTFTGLQNVKSLDISNNSLTYIVKRIFHRLDQLRELYIDNNLLTTINSWDFLQHLKMLKKVSLMNNPWVCKSLLNAITKFGQHKIDVVKGMYKKTTNVNGISCYNYKNLKQQLELTTLINNLTSTVTNYNRNKFYNFFNKGFFNTTFFHFFNNTNFDFEHKLINIFQKQINNTLNYSLSELINHFSELEEKKIAKYVIPIITSQPNFENLSDDFEERHFNKMFSTLYGNFVLFVVIVIILICLLAVVIIKNFYNLFSCFPKRNSVARVEI